MANPKLNLALLAMLICAALASQFIGETPLTVDALYRLFTLSSTPLEQIVLVDIRLPRTLIAAVVGASLAAAGAAIQGLVRNPLADPSIIGASQGAAVGAACVFYYGALSFLGGYAVSVAAFAGALIALSVVMAIANKRAVLYILLAGLCVNTLGAAILALQLNFAPNPFAVQELVFWLMGSVANLGISHFYLLAPIAALGFALLLVARPYLLALTLGEKTAVSMGFNATKYQWIVTLGVALLVGASVAVAGAIGFIGLVVPHLIRPFVGNRPDQLLIPSALAGASLLIVADILVQSLPTSNELKVGVVTSLLGGPLFIIIVAKGRSLWPS